MDRAVWIFDTTPRNFWALLITFIAVEPPGTKLAAMGAAILTSFLNLLKKPIAFHLQT